MVVVRDHQRIPSLDGLRAISISLVILSHFVPCLHLPWSARALGFFDIGRAGVKIFFVISGFLITLLLLGELEKTHTISLRRFYFRRTLRIFPPYYCFLAVMLVLHTLGRVSAFPGEFLHAATYTSDYSTNSWNLGHTWSLSVEEQFYLLWPALLLLLGKRRGLCCAALLLVASPITRVWKPSLYRLDIVADSLAVGCLLAGLRNRLLRDRRVKRLMESNWPFLLAFGLVILIEMLATRQRIVPGWMFNLCLISIQNVLIAIIIYWSILNYQSAIGRLLNCAPLSFIGVLSYSLYIWQQPFLNHYLDSSVTRFPLNLLALAACALVSYYCVERPALSLRRKLDARFSHQQDDLAVALAANPAETTEPG